MISLLVEMVIVNVEVVQVVDFVENYLVFMEKNVSYLKGVKDVTSSNVVVVDFVTLLQVIFVIVPLSFIVND